MRKLCCPKERIRRKGIEDGELVYRAGSKGEAGSESPLILQTRVSMEVIGWIGTTLVIIAWPKIRHLRAEKCA
jgi:hypothetical protein